MMKNVLIISVLMLTTVYSIEHSLRIQALGSDFAYLVPDYETDLYLDPNILGEKRLLGVCWLTDSDELILRAFTGRFGWCGKYWGSYGYNNDPYDKDIRLDARDFWMLDLRGKLWKFLTDDVWNFYGDAQYVYSYNYLNSSHYDTTIVAKFFPGMTGSTKLNSYFKLITTVHVGFYLNDVDSVDYGTHISYEKWYIPVSGRIGLHYRKIRSETDFTSFYVMIGGPITTSEIDALPYSIWTGTTGDDVCVSYFLNAPTATMGFARGLNILDRGMFIWGMQNDFLMQYTDDSLVSGRKHALRNTLAIPVAVEYNLGRIALRFGLFMHYSYYRDKTTSFYNPQIATIQYGHSLSTGRSLGLTWSISDKFTVDFLHTGLRFWCFVDIWSRCNIYLKYTLK